MYTFTCIRTYTRSQRWFFTALEHFQFEHLLEWKGLAECSESNTLHTSVVLDAQDEGGGVSGVLGELGADDVLSVSLSGILL